MVLISMRRLSSFLPAVLTAALLAVAWPLRVLAVSEAPELLMEALKKVAADQNRWAYTETSVQKDDKGKIKKQTVVRVDPSKPYAEQFTLLSINGRDPTEREQKPYRRRGEKLGEDAERRERGVVQSSSRRWPTVGEIVDLERAVMTAEDDKAITYKVPLKKNDRYPAEKFELVARLNKELRAVENVAVKLREPMRTKLVVKVKSGDATVDFTPVDSKYAPVMSSIQGEAAASVLFVNIGGTYDLKRVDFKRVKPYSDRFGVEIGATQALDF